MEALDYTPAPADDGRAFQSLWFCKTCRRETPHEVRRGAGVIARLCVPCLERSLNYELDRD